MQFLLSNRVKAIDELRLFKNHSVARVKLTKQQENLKPRPCCIDQATARSKRQGNYYRNKLDF